MKYSRFIHLIALVLFQLYGGLAWAQEFTIQDIDETGTNQPLIAAEVINDSTIVIVGANAALRTTNTGQTWSATLVPGIFQDVTFPTDSIGYAIGFNSKIMKTVNQGVTWFEQNTSIIAPVHTGFRIAFLNADTGFAAFSNGPSYAFLATINGGVTWANTEEGSVYGRSRVLAINDSTIYALPDDISMFQSTDYGNTWEERPIPLGIGNTSDMFFFNPDTGIVAFGIFNIECGRDFIIARTEDKGINWLILDTMVCTNFNQISFPSIQVGYAQGKILVNGARVMWRTIDGGYSWTQVEYPVGQSCINNSCTMTCLACINNDTCFIPTNYGAIIKMTNGTGGLLNVPDEITGSKLRFKLFPNPAQTHVNIDAPDRIITFRLYNSMGAVVKSGQPFSERLELDLNGLAPGIYLVEVQTEKGVGVEKLVVEK